MHSRRALLYVPGDDRHKIEKPIHSRLSGKIVKAFTIYQKRGSGAFAMDGKMVDLPLIKAAKRVLESARAADKV